MRPNSGRIDAASTELRESARVRRTRPGSTAEVRAGTVAPFDMVRTKLMNQPPDKIEFTGFVDCFVKVVKKDGPGGLYRGFFPIWARFAPTTTLQLIFFERFRAALGMDSL